MMNYFRFSPKISAFRDNVEVKEIWSLSAQSGNVTNKDKVKEHIWHTKYVNKLGSQNSLTVNILTPGFSWRTSPQ